MGIFNCCPTLDLKDFRVNSEYGSGELSTFVENDKGSTLENYFELAINSAQQKIGEIYPSLMNTFKEFFEQEHNKMKDFMALKGIQYEKIIIYDYYIFGTKSLSPSCGVCEATRFECSIKFSRGEKSKLEQLKYVRKWSLDSNPEKNRQELAIKDK